MLQLVANTEEATSASIPMRWCVGRDTLAKLRAKGALNPHLLLVVTNGNFEVARRLVPIDQMMEYIDFRMPGNHKILATIVWNSQGNARVLKKRFFGGTAINEYGYVHRFDKMDVLDNEGNLDVDCRQYKPDHEFAVCTLDEAAQIEVNVAEEFFAAPPSKFEQFWVNFWFERAPRDQCQFRRRRMLAYTMQPPIVLLYMLAKMILRSVVALFLLLCGQRRVNLQPLIHPWVMDNDDVWRNTRYSVFIINKNGKPQPLILAFFAPIIHVVVVIGAYVATYFQPSLSFWQIVGLAEGVVAVVAALLYLLGAAFWLYEAVSNTTEGTSPSIMAYAALGSLAIVFILFAIYHPLIVGVMMVVVVISSLAIWLATIETRRLDALPVEERKRVSLEREYARYLPVACNGPMVASYSALPKERRTVYLFYRDLKAKVCKQFAT